MDDRPPWEGEDEIPADVRAAIQGLTPLEKLKKVKDSKKVVNGVVTVDLTPFAVPDDKDDDWSIFKVKKRYDQAQRQKNLTDAEEKLSDRWIVHTEYHWSTTLNGEKLNYWPSRNKFQYQGKILYGDVHGFIRNREKNDDGK